MRLILPRDTTKRPDPFDDAVVRVERETVGWDKDERCEDVVNEDAPIGLGHDSTLGFPFVLFVSFVVTI